MWPRKEGFIWAELNEKPACSLPLIAVGREGVSGNSPTEWPFLPPSLSYDSKHTYNLDHENHKTLFTRWTLKIESLYSWTWLLLLLLPLFFCRYSACFYCLFAQCFLATQRKKRTHTQDRVHICVLFCNDIFNKGMYSVLFGSR